jgi:hypothetical protein
VSGRTRVRCPRPLQPRWIRIHRCGGTGHGWCTGFDGSLWSVSGLVVAARIGPGGQRWSNVGRAWLARGSTPDLALLRRRPGCGAELAAWPTRGAGPGPGAGRLVGEQGRSRCSQVPAGACWAGCRRAGRPWAGPGGGDHARWSVRWWWSGVVRRWRAHPVQRGADCGRSAAAVCQERCPLGADSALTCENCGGRDRV